MIEQIIPGQPRVFGPPDLPLAEAVFWAALVILVGLALATGLFRLWGGR